jgi:hypothetical protein
MVAVVTAPRPSHPGGKAAALVVGVVVLIVLLAVVSTYGIG